jgi:hypothetical protein
MHSHRALAQAGLSSYQIEFPRGSNPIIRATRDTAFQPALVIFHLYIRANTLSVYHDDF